MSEHKPQITRVIPAARWQEWCAAVTDGNRGRAISVSLVDHDLGAETLAERVPMIAVDRDPAIKTKDIIIIFGDEESPTVHVVSAPVRLWQIEDAGGLVGALEIEETNGRRTVLNFE
jgi:hypothetical protein